MKTACLISPSICGGEQLKVTHFRSIMTIQTTTTVTYTCDRCGRQTDYIEANGHTSTESWINTVWHSYRENNITHENDLCDICAEEYRSFMTPDPSRR